MAIRFLMVRRLYRIPETGTHDRHGTVFPERPDLAGLPFWKDTLLTVLRLKHTVVNSYAQLFNAKKCKVVKECFQEWCDDPDGEWKETFFDMSISELKAWQEENPKKKGAGSGDGRNRVGGTSKADSETKRKRKDRDHEQSEDEERRKRKGKGKAVEKVDRVSKKDKNKKRKVQPASDDLDGSD